MLFILVGFDLDLWKYVTNLHFELSHLIQAENMFFMTSWALKNIIEFFFTKCRENYEHYINFGFFFFVLQIGCLFQFSIGAQVPQTTISKYFSLRSWSITKKNNKIENF